MKKTFLSLFTLLLIIAAFFCGCSKSEYADVRISEVMSSNVSVLADENGKFCDWIELYNPTERDIDLSGYSLTDNGMKADKFIFPSVVLKSGECLVVFADGNYKADVQNRIFHAPFKISSSNGEGIRLYNKDRVLVSILNLPLLESNISFGIDSNGKECVLDTPTPGKPNEKEIEASYSENKSSTKSNANPADKVRINEYSTTKTQTILDSDGDFESWVELYNSGKNDADLSGLFLSDDAADKEKWAFPNGCKIKSGGFLLVFLSGKEKECKSGGELHATFRLNGKEEKLYLFDKSKNELSSIKVFDLFSNLSCGINAKGKTVFFSNSTPGAENSATGFDKIESAAKTKSKELVITEVAAVNTTVTAPDGKARDYIELLNNSKSKINLKNYRLSDSKKAEGFHKLPDYTVSPGEYCVIFCGDETTVKGNNVYCSIGLNRYGETVYLAEESGVIADSLEYGRLFDGYVCGRDVSGSDSPVYFASYTPKKKNKGAPLSKAPADPVFSKSSTYVKKGESISLSCTDGVIRYTLDSSVPTEKSPVYKEPLIINKTTVVRARCFKNGSVPSGTVSATYVVGRKSKLDVVFLTTDNNNLYGSKNGIWANGKGYTKEFPHVGANYWQDWERPVTFEFMTADGRSQICFDAGISVFGQFSRTLKQKSVAIKLRDKYGPDEICYPFFENNVNVFSSLVLRNSGQDFEIAHIRDAFCSQVIKGSVDVDFMDYKPVVCYVNGKYHGIYDLREKIDEDYLKNHYGVDENNVDLIKGNNIVSAGFLDGYRKLQKYIKTHDVTKDGVYDYICSQIDIDELISYWMCESFFSNTDTGNIRFWRENKNGAKWRWIFFDADWSLFPSTYKQSSVSNYLDPNGHGVSDAFDTTIMSSLIKNKKFRKRLLEIHAKHLNTTFSTKRLLGIFDGMINEIDEEMKYHTERWESLGYNRWKSNVALLRGIIKEKREIFIDDLINTLKLSKDEIALLKGNE